jgi:hypothetical protein
MEAVEKKIEEVLESKTEEIDKKVDEAEVKIEETVENVATDIEKKIEDILENASPEVKKVVDVVESKLIEVIDGRVFSCSCFGFLWSLRIARKSPQTPPSKSEETQNKETPQQVQDTQPKQELNLPTSPQEVQTEKVTPQ